MASQLIIDPSTRMFAALAGWKHPASRVELALMQLGDDFRAANSDPKRGRPERYPRPWPDPNQTRYGSVPAGVDARAVLKRLREGTHGG